MKMIWKKNKLGENIQNLREKIWIDILKVLGTIVKIWQFVIF